jgi:hypothetical protein
VPAVIFWVGWWREEGSREKKNKSVDQVLKNRGSIPGRPLDVNISIFNVPVMGKRST